MEQYAPSFSITNKMLTRVAQIAEKAGRISNYRAFETKPHLRRNNRIHSIHSSLAIEANALSLDEVKSIISGKTVIGPQKEIQEVKNAYQDEVHRRLKRWLILPRVCALSFAMKSG